MHLWGQYEFLTHSNGGAMKKLNIVSLLLLIVFTLTIVEGKEKWLNPDNPEDAVKIMRKVSSSLIDNEPTYFWFYGSVYSHKLGEKDRHLFDYQGLNVRATKTVSNEENGYGYEYVSREVLFYLDPKTGELIHEWDNPWTGKKVDIIHIANDPVNSRYPTYAYGKRGPFKLPAVVQGGHFMMNMEIPLFYPNPLGGDYQKQVGGYYQAHEMFNWFGRTNDLFDESKPTSTDVNVGWARSAQWLPWMEMGSIEGSTLYHGLGKRVVSFEDLPDVLKNTIREKYPKYEFPPPIDDERPNMTSWIYYKKLMNGDIPNPWE